MDRMHVNGSGSFQTSFVMDWIDHWRTNLGFVKLVNEALKVPAWEYAVVVCAVLIVQLYHALDFHFIGDLLTGLRGDKVKLVHSPVSEVAARVLSKCQVLNRRYWPTLWLCSPHLQTTFVHFHGRPPKVEYKRELFVAPDGGTIALDWIDPEFHDRPLEETPIVIIIPGLSSESSNPYMKHLVHGMAVKGWRAVVMNHRGLGGVQITSERFYHAGWTNDLRWFTQELRKRFPKALLLAVGASVGANILVKYLGEEGDNTPLGGAASICNPWDLVVCDRFIARKPVQKLYDIAVATGLTDFVIRHATTISKMSNWNFIRKSRSIRTFDHLFTISVHKFGTVDDYYRRSSSAHYLGSVSIPLFAVSSLDDPLCTKEAIPWDECRINPNVVLAVTEHGGHLAYFEGLTAKTIWWVRAVQEVFSALISTSLLHVPKEVSPCVDEPVPLSLQEVTEELTTANENVIIEEVSSDTSGRLEVLNSETQTIPAEVESTIFVDDKGLNIQMCLKTREEMLALHSALTRILATQPAPPPRLEQPTQVASSSHMSSKQALLLLAIPLVGSALVIGLRRRNLKALRSWLPY